MLCSLKDTTVELAPWIARDTKDGQLTGSTLSDVVLGAASLLTFSSPQDALRFARDSINNVKVDECEVYSVEITGSKIELVLVPKEKIRHRNKVLTPESA